MNIKNKIKIFILGIGGRAKLIRELLIRINDKYNFIFYKDINSINFKKVNHFLRLDKKSRFFIGISDPKIQKKNYDFLKKKLIRIDQNPIIDPTAIIKSGTSISKNVIILENSSIGPDVILKKNTFIGSNVIINHNTKIGSFTTIGHGSNVSANVIISDQCYIGNSTTIKENIKINKSVSTECSSNIISNCDSNKNFSGNPAK